MKIIMKIVVKIAFHINKEKSLRIYLRTATQLWSKAKDGEKWFLHKKWSFLLRISSVNVTESQKTLNFSHLLKKSLMENIIFCAVNNGYVKNIWTNIYLILQTDHFSHYLLAYHQSKHEDIMQARIKCIKVSFKKSTEFRMPLR